jgi:hypothetical protein
MIHLPFSDDHPTLLKISESPDRQADAAAMARLIGVREENGGTEQAEYCRYGFDHRHRPDAPGGQRTACVLHSQNDSTARREFGPR